MKLFVVILVSFLLNACYSTGIAQSSSFPIEVWKKKMISKIKAEKSLIRKSEKGKHFISYYTSLEHGIASTPDRITIHPFDTLRQHLGEIPRGASAFFVQYSYEGEVFTSYEVMFWIKGNKYEGVWLDNELRIHPYINKGKYLRKLSKFKTNLRNKLLIYTGEVQILITEFKDNKIIDVNFVAIVSLYQSQFLEIKILE